MSEIKRIKQTMKKYGMPYRLAVYFLENVDE
jgi:hypothetical protein